MIVAFAIVLFVVSLFFLLTASVHYPPDDAVLFWRSHVWRLREGSRCSCLFAS